MTNTMGCLVDNVNTGDGMYSVVVADWELEIWNVRVRVLIMWLSQLQL